MRTVKTDHMGWSPGWSESLLGIHVILLVLSCSSSNVLQTETKGYIKHHFLKTSVQFCWFGSKVYFTEPSHEIMVLFVLCKLILQTYMYSHPTGIDTWFFGWPFVYFQTLCVRTAKALVRLRRCADSLELSLVTYVISNRISWAD